MPILKRFHFILFLCLLASIRCNAQTSNLRIGGFTFGGQIGQDIDVNSSYYARVTQVFYFRKNPTWQSTIDYRLSDIISIGLAYNYHNAAQYAPTRVIRIDSALRLLCHYDKKEQFNFYSGLRIGYTTDEIYIPGVFDQSGREEFQSKNNLNAGIILFGMRYWMYKQFGLTLEIQLARPYFANIGVATRLE